MATQISNKSIIDVLTGKFNYSVYDHINPAIADLYTI